MTQITLIGSSHVAALKLGWEQIQSNWQDIELRFLALPGKSFRKLQINGQKHFGALTPERFKPDVRRAIETGFGASHVDLSKADAVVQIGWYLHEGEVARLLGAYSIDGLHTQPRLPRMSLPAYSAFCDALALHTLPAKPWRNWTSPQLFFVPKPRKCETCLKDPAPAYDVWRRFADLTPDGAPRLSGYSQRVSQALEAVGARLIPLPDKLHAETGLTRARFGRNAPSLSAGETYGAEDHHHMNEDYGAIALTHILDRVTAAMRQKENEHALG
ncbi:hypothetical protein [Primorskyibacter sp. S187A]|uniref:hypothetical protein n=1 Tax=Primorskyibacter sp. S187A TaxID=3415130 RepID=UPI003C7BFD83